MKTWRLSQSAIRPPLDAVNSRVSCHALSSFAFLVLAAVMLAGTASTASAQDRSEDGFKPIFDGQSLTGWSGDGKLWRVEDGAIVGETTASNAIEKNEFLVWRQGDLDNFTLRLQFRISGTESANSGVQVRSFVNDSGGFSGYQADIARANGITGSLYSEGTKRDVLCPRGKSRTNGQPPQALRKPAAFASDGWNEMTISARDSAISVDLNGVRSARFVDDEKLGQRQGLLGFQLHSGPPMKIEFKNIQLKRLPLIERKKVVFVAGKKSHEWGSHEHNAGCMLLAKCLSESNEEQQVPVLSTVYQNGWPADPTAFDNADTIVAFCDGGGRHFLHRNREAFESIMRRGVGLVCVHYAVEVPKGPSGKRFLDWIGGYFETHWSVNPIWTAKFDRLPDHPIARGVKPFELTDEWYYHMRFSSRVNVTPILSTLPGEGTLTRPDGPHQNNPHVRAAVLEKKEPQHVAWAFVRGDSVGRGFGYTGAHFHKNWANDSVRKLVLNAIIWTAHGEVPRDGIESKTPTQAELDANQDYPKPKKLAK
jgi:type 1 glutamine amidotransferase